MNDDDLEVFVHEQATSMRMTFGDLECSVTVATNLSPDAIDTTLNDVRKQLVAASRQLDMVQMLDVAEDE